MILLASTLELVRKKKCRMSKLIIDAAKDNIFFMIINENNVYNITHENTKTNYEKLMILINNFLSEKKYDFKSISKIYVNKGPGSFAGIRNSLSMVKAINLATKIDYYGFSFEDFTGETNVKYENIPYLCDKFNVKKNLIKPIYIS